MPNWKKLITSGSDASLNALYVDANVQAASLTGSLSYNDLTGVPTLISSSEQVTLSSTNGFSSFSSSIDTHLDTNISALSASVDTHLDANITTVNNTITSISSSVDSRILTEKGRIDAILLSADADKDSFAEIVSLINSVDTTNDSAFAAFYTASTGRLSSLESYTSSLQSTSLVSGSSQIDITNTTGYTAFSSSIDTQLDSNIAALSSSTHTQRVALDSLQTTANSNLSSSAHSQRLSLITALSSSVDTHLDVNIAALSSSAHTHRVSLLQPVNTNISNLNSFSSSLQTTEYNFTGSFAGDGSGLTGLNVDVTETTTVLDTFSNKTSVSVPHNFGTKNVIVSVYDSNDAQILPDSVITTDVNTVTVGFCESTSGRVIVAKGGHLVSGSIELFTHREAISGSNSYTITHNLNEDYPIVQVYDSNKQQVLPQTITSTNSNTVTVSFCDILSGIIVVKK